LISLAFFISLFTAQHVSNVNTPILQVYIITLSFLVQSAFKAAEERGSRKIKNKISLIFSFCLHCVIAQDATTPSNAIISDSSLEQKWDLRKTKDEYGKSVV
jgi:hypothetical protein